MSWNDKLVSVILLSYNSADQLPRALGSVFAQDYPRLEIIVTDDGSEEFSEEEVREYIETHKTPNIERYCVISSPENTGTVRNLRRALKEVRGDYYINFGADDAIYSNTVISEYIHTFYLRNWEPLVVSGRLGMYTSDLGKYLRSLPTLEESRVLLQEDPQATLNALASSCVLTNVASCFRRDFPELVDAYDTRYKLYEDYPTFLRMARKGYTPVFINRIMMKHAAGGVANGTTNLDLATALYHDRVTMWETEFEPYRELFTEESIAANKKRRDYEKKIYEKAVRDANPGRFDLQRIYELIQKVIQKFSGRYNKLPQYLKAAALSAIAFFAFWSSDLLGDGVVSRAVCGVLVLLSVAAFVLSGVIFVCRKYRLRIVRKEKK